jgi:ATP-dependent DNA helicase DinG
MRTFADAEQVLAQRLEGYAPRPQQQTLAAAVEELLARGKGQLLAQAGCGVGKSLGSVIPALLARTIDSQTGRERPQRVIVATATKALQGQYAGKDMPFLEEHLPIDVKWALLKGRANYVCRAKLNEVTTMDLLNAERIRTELADPEHTGDFEDLENKVPADKQYLLSMSSSECPGKNDCPFGEVCFAEAAKARAKAAQLVVTNIAMLMTDLKIRQATDNGVEMLGDYDAAIIDEGHELDVIAQDALTDQLRRGGIDQLLTQSENFITEHSRVVVDDEGRNPRLEKIRARVAEIREAVETFWARLDELALGDKEQAEEGDKVELKMSTLEDQMETFITIAEGMRFLEEDVAETQITFGNLDSEGTRQARLTRRLISMTDRLTDLVVGKGLVRWIETVSTGKGQRATLVTVVNYAPIEVGPFLQEHLWSRVPVALVSATLSTGSDFSYITRALGLEEPTTLDVGTPFDYRTQSLLFVPDKGQPDPKRDKAAWGSYAINTTLNMVTAAGGGALLLYTSRKAMQAAYAMIAPELEARGITTLMQGEHGTNKEISQVFNTDRNSVLFALRSFMTGVDFAGETCRLVIIDKLPFPVPSDILFNARAMKINREMQDEWASFRHLSIPMMSLVLIQAFGRLIRSVDDKGVVAILDPRLSAKGYGKTILGTLPNAPVTRDLTEVAGFFGG